MTSRSSPATSLSGLLLGCGLVIGGDPITDGGDPIADDIAQYEELVATLDAAREQALDNTATAVTTAGPWLAWLDGSVLGLRRYPDGLELELPAPGPSYRVGLEHAVTTERSANAIILRVHELPSGELVDEWQLSSDGGDPRLAWLDEVLMVVEGDTVFRWPIGIEPPVELGSLALAGVAAERIDQLEAVEQRLVLRVEGQLWILELESFAAVTVAELDELLAVDRRGLLFTHADALWLYQFETASVRVDQAIAASGWSLNSTFAHVHEYAGAGATLAADRVFYVGSAGLFAYALDQSGPEAITPILIEPRWDVGAGIPRIEYREPCFAGGVVFARGLIGPHGEIGETGPIFAVAQP